MVNFEGMECLIDQVYNRISYDFIKNDINADTQELFVSLQKNKFVDIIGWGKCDFKKAQEFIHYVFTKSKRLKLVTSELEFADKILKETIKDNHIKPLTDSKKWSGGLVNLLNKPVEYLLGLTKLAMTSFGELGANAIYKNIDKITKELSSSHYSVCIEKEPGFYRMRNFFHPDINKDVSKLIYRLIERSAVIFNDHLGIKYSDSECTFFGRSLESIIKPYGLTLGIDFNKVVVQGPNGASKSIGELVNIVPSESLKKTEKRYKNLSKNIKDKLSLEDIAVYHTVPYTYYLDLEDLPEYVGIKAINNLKLDINTIEYFGLTEDVINHIANNELINNELVWAGATYNAPFYETVVNWPGKPIHNLTGFFAGLALSTTALIGSYLNDSLNLTTTLASTTLLTVPWLIGKLVNDNLYDKISKKFYKNTIEKMQRINQINEDDINSLEMIINTYRRKDKALHELGSGTLTINSDGLIIRCNDSTSKILKKNKNEIIGNYINNVNSILNKEFKQTGKGKIKINDSLIHYSCKALYENGVYTGSVIALGDISIYEKYDEVNEKYSISRGVIHDIRNILTSILFYTQKISDRRKEEDLNHYFDKVKEFSNLLKGYNINQEMESDLTSLLSDTNNKELKEKEIKQYILDINNKIYEVVNILEINLGKKTEIKEMVNLSKIIKESIFDLKNHNIQVYDKIEDNISIRGYPAQLKMAIYNLLYNAKEAISKKGVIKVNASYNEVKKDNPFELEAGFYAYFSVTDNGKGIKQDKLKKIFERGYTDKKQGTGIGLDQVQKIVKIHNGVVYPVSKIGEGTTFHILIPSDYKIQANILVVDDEPMIREIFSIYLTDKGYNVTDVNNGRDALNLLQNNSYDLIFLDMNLNDKHTGEEYARKISQIIPDQKIVLCTGYDVQHDDYFILKKPVSCDDLVNVVETALQPSKN